MKTFKLLGLLLTYPEGTVLSHADEIVNTLRDEALLPKKQIARVARFLSEQANKDLLDVQEAYVETFDRGRAHCLHLFEHIHGESRDRGQAMVNLSEAYAEKGLRIDANELPDYLPLFLEYLSHCDFKEASELLGETVDIIAVIAAKLKKRQSPYADVFAAIEALSALKPDKVKVTEVMEKTPKDPQTLEELDEEWKEAEAFSGDPVADCNACSTGVGATKPIDKTIDTIKWEQ